jgi:hypothetical protein
LVGAGVAVLATKKDDDEGEAPASTEPAASSEEGNAEEPTAEEPKSEV